MYVLRCLYKFYISTVKSGFVFVTLRVRELYAGVERHTFSPTSVIQIIINGYINYAVHHYR